MILRCVRQMTPSLPLSLAQVVVDPASYEVGDGSVDPFLESHIHTRNRYIDRVD